MPKVTRRQVLTATIPLAASGAGVTTMAGLERASVSGDIDVQAERALTVTDVSVDGGNASFTRVGDDGTRVHVAVEANNGDRFSITQAITNAAAASVAVRIVVRTPDDIAVVDSGLDANDDDELDANEGDDVVQSGAEEYVTRLPPGETGVVFGYRIADTAVPGAREMTIDFEPLSTDD
jgi:hypothetical protein